jgi:pimeloyl-ACP methyl ester carboxylesterase
VIGVDNRAEVREFLFSRRNRLAPAQVQLPAGTNRRVPGLRRSSLRELAGLFPNADLVVQPAAGHFPWADDPVAFATLVSARLRS